MIHYLCLGIMLMLVCAVGLVVAAASLAFVVMLARDVVRSLREGRRSS